MPKKLDICYRKHDESFYNRVAYRKLSIHFSANLLDRNFQQKFWILNWTILFHRINESTTFSPLFTRSIFVQSRLPPFPPPPQSERTNCVRRWRHNQFFSAWTAWCFAENVYRQSSSAWAPLSSLEKGNHECIFYEHRFLRFCFTVFSFSFSLDFRRFFKIMSDHISCIQLSCSLIYFFFGNVVTYGLPGLIFYFKV